MQHKKITCATSFGKEGIKVYADMMISSFIANWPKDITLHVYLDDINDQLRLPQAANVKYLLLNHPELTMFKQRNAHDPRKHGLNTFADNEAGNSFTKPKEGKWRFDFDAIRFCHKVFAMAQCFESAQDIAIWIDGDTKTFAKVTRDDIAKWLPVGKFAGFLDRPSTYTETGFHIFDVNHSVAKDFFNKWLQYYRDDTIFSLSAWTDCHTYDAARRQFDQSNWFNLSPPNAVGVGGHVFINGPLGAFMDHMKGKRKLRGKSNKGDLFVNRNEKYWNEQ